MWHLLLVNANRFCLRQKLSTCSCSQVSFALFSQSKYVIERKQKRLFFLALVEIAVYKLQSNFSMLHAYEQIRLKGLPNEILKLKKFAPPKGNTWHLNAFRILLSARGVLVSIWSGSRYAVLLWSLKTGGAFLTFWWLPIPWKHGVFAWWCFFQLLIFFGQKYAQRRNSKICIFKATGLTH